MNNIEKLRIEYAEFKKEVETPKESKTIEVYEWLLLTQYARLGLNEALAAVKDAYNLGYMNGKKSKKRKNKR